MIKIFVTFILLFANQLLAVAQPSSLINLKIEEDDIIIGESSAPITLIEYSSLTCPHCAYFHKNVFDEFKRLYIDTNQVKYIHRDFPMDQVALKATILTHCAPKEQYYNFLKILFEKQTGWSVQKNYLEILENIGKLGGLSGQKFQSCLNDKELEDKILATRLKAMNELKITETPTYIVNNKVYSGARNLNAFKEMIKQATN